jgi:hypothetical protein
MDLCLREGVARQDKKEAPRWQRHSTCSSIASRRATRYCLGKFPEALGVYMEMVRSRTGGVNDMTFAVLPDIRAAALN